MDPWALLAALPDPVVVVDAETRLLWCNRAASDWSGWELDELVGQPVDTLCHPDDLATAIVSLDSVQQKDVGTAVEVRFRNRAGYYHNFEVRGQTALHDPGVGGVVLVLRNTTDRRRWELSAGDSAMMQAIADRVPAIMVVLEADGTVRGATRGLTSLLGHDLESALGGNLVDLVSPGDRARVAGELKAIATTPGSRSFSTSFLAADGTTVPPMGVTAVNLLDDRVVKGLVLLALATPAAGAAGEAVPVLDTAPVMPAIDDEPLMALPTAAQERRVMSAIDEGRIVVGDVVSLAREAGVSVPVASATVANLKMRNLVAPLVNQRLADGRSATLWTLTPSGRARHLGRAAVH